MDAASEILGHDATLNSVHTHLLKGQGEPAMYTNTGKEELFRNSSNTHSTSYSQQVTVFGVELHIQ